MMGRKSEFGGDLLERVLRVGKAKLMAEEVRFRRTAVGRGNGAREIEGWLYELLRLLHQVRDVEHDGGEVPQAVRGGGWRLCEKTAGVQPRRIAE